MGIGFRQLIAAEDSGFEVSGDGCVTSWNWHDEAGTSVAMVSALPGVAGCPETMRLHLGEIQTIEVSDQGKLIARAGLSRKRRNPLRGGGFGCDSCS